MEEQIQPKKSIMKLSLSQILGVKVYIPPARQKLYDIVMAFGMKEQ